MWSGVNGRPTLTSPYAQKAAYLRASNLQGVSHKVKN
jgi:hypothetical protein